VIRHPKATCFGDVNFSWHGESWNRGVALSNWLPSVRFRPGADIWADSWLGHRTSCRHAL